MKLSSVVVYRTTKEKKLQFSLSKRQINTYLLLNVYEKVEKNYQTYPLFELTPLFVA